LADVERESMEYDVVIVGASPSGLSAAIQLKQLEPDLSMVVLRQDGHGGDRPCRAVRAPQRGQ
jgi:electron-transferring-flavoprotein dehydrogenase